MKPTEDQVKAEVAKLKEMKPNIRHHSAFGDNHHDAIDAQIAVLEDGIGDDEIYDEWEKKNVRDAALEARRWRDGEDQEETPSNGWESLLQS